jgi:hypothetical protein
MDKLDLSGSDGAMVHVDLCYACRGLWFDPMENLKLSAAAVVALFGQLHAHRTAPVQPLARRLDCPRCTRALTEGFDLVKSGRYITYRCAQKHGRFAPFASFMVEKGFVRQLTRAEVDDLAAQVGVVACTSCGAPVDVRKDAACPYCRAPLSLLDPHAVERALQGYARASQQAGGVKIPELADALVQIERDRARAQREARAKGGLLNAPLDSPDLWREGLAAVWRMLN